MDILSEPPNSQQKKSVKEITAHKLKVNHYNFEDGFWNFVHTIYHTKVFLFVQMMKL